MPRATAQPGTGTWNATSTGAIGIICEDSRDDARESRRLCELVCDGRDKLSGVVPLTITPEKETEDGDRLGNEDI